MLRLSRLGHRLRLVRRVRVEDNLLRNFHLNRGKSSFREEMNERVGLKWKWIRLQSLDTAIRRSILENGHTKLWEG